MTAGSCTQHCEAKQLNRFVKPHLHLAHQPTDWESAHRLAAFFFPLRFCCWTGNGSSSCSASIFEAVSALMASLGDWYSVSVNVQPRGSPKSVSGVGSFRASDPCGCGERILFPGSDGQFHFDVHGLVSGVADHGNELRRHEPDHYVDRYWQTLV